jgi:hypothetical protein
MLTVVLAFATANAYAATPQWGNQVSITLLEAQTSGSFFISTSGNQNFFSCSTPSLLMVTDTTYKFVVATLIAAQTSGQTVALYYNGCSGGGTTGYPVITAVSVPHT